MKKIITIVITIASWGNVVFEISDDFIVKSIQYGQLNIQEIILTESKTYYGFESDYKNMVEIENADFIINEENLDLENATKIEVSENSYLLLSEYFEEIFMMVYVFKKIPELELLSNFDASEYFYMLNNTDINFYFFNWKGVEISKSDVHIDVKVGELKDLKELSVSRLTEIGYMVK